MIINNDNNILFICICVTFVIAILALYFVITNMQEQTDKILESVQGVYGSVTVASTEPILTGKTISGNKINKVFNLTGSITIDGYTLEPDDLVLLKDEDSAADNGIYIYKNNTLSRSSNLNSPLQIIEGNTIFVKNGDTNKNATFSLLKSSLKIDNEDEITGNGVVFTNTSVLLNNLVSETIVDGYTPYADSSKPSGMSWRAELAHNYNSLVDPTATDDSVNGLFSIGSNWINTVNGQIYVCIDSTENNAIWSNVSLGSFYQYAVASGVDTNNTIVYKETLSLTTSSIPAGKYRVGWYYQYRYNNGSTDFVCQVVVDSLSTVHEHVEEPKDQSDNQRSPTSGFVEINLLAGVHSIIMQFAGTDPVESQVFERRLEIWKVG
jgi:hypothetical protein